jgi:predicted enzyme related to lactoylglutathione lyase
MQMDRYDHGVPSWVDTGSTDLAATVAFYTQLFGWTVEDLGAESNHYHLLKDHGRGRRDGAST